MEYVVNITKKVNGKCYIKLYYFFGVESLFKNKFHWKKIKYMLGVDISLLFSIKGNLFFQ